MLRRLRRIWRAWRSRIAQRDDGVEVGAGFGLALDDIVSHSKAEVLVPPRNRMSEGRCCHLWSLEWPLSPTTAAMPVSRLSSLGRCCVGRALPDPRRERAATHGIRKVASGASEDIPASQYHRDTATLTVHPARGGSSAVGRRFVAGSPPSA